MGESKIEYFVRPMGNPSWLRPVMLAQFVLLIIGVVASFALGNPLIGVFLIAFSFAGLMITYPVSQLNSAVEKYRYTIDFKEKTIHRKMFFASGPLTSAFEALYDFGSSMNLRGSSTLRFENIIEMDHQVRDEKPMIHIRVRRAGGLAKNWFMEIPEGEEGERIYSELEKHISV